MPIHYGEFEIAFAFEPEAVLLQVGVCNPLFSGLPQNLSDGYHAILNPDRSHAVVEG
jgi:hypothetical protein